MGKCIHQLAVEMAEARGALNMFAIVMRTAEAHYNADVLNELAQVKADAETAFKRAHSAWEAASIDAAIAAQHRVDSYRSDVARGAAEIDAAFDAEPASRRKAGRHV